MDLSRWVGKTCQILAHLLDDIRYTVCRYSFVHMTYLYIYIYVWMSPRLVLSPSIFEAHPPCLVVGWTSPYLLYSTLSSGWNMTGQVPPETGGFTRFKASGVVGSKRTKKHVLHQLYSGFKRTNIQGASCKSPRGSPDVSNVPQPCPVSPFHPETYRINITPSSAWVISLLILPVTLAIDRPRPIY